mmetsp:Transcript_90589/g.251904  ORF Transcript_90589/g.251904 Transcript_90589/m.251904 type:complete len:268 (+) Transcript_90589:702-1505(+)
MQRCRTCRCLEGHAQHGCYGKRVTAAHPSRSVRRQVLQDRACREARRRRHQQRAHKARRSDIALARGASPTQQGAHVAPRAAPAIGRCDGVDTSKRYLNARATRLAWGGWPGKVLGLKATLLKVDIHIDRNNAYGGPRIPHALRRHGLLASLPGACAGGPEPRAGPVEEVGQLTDQDTGVAEADPGLNEVIERADYGTVKAHDNSKLPERHGPDAGPGVVECRVAAVQNNQELCQLSQVPCHPLRVALELPIGGVPAQEAAVSCIAS